MNNINFNHKIVLITGASRGIGRKILLSLGKANAIVIGTATNDNSLANINQDLEKNNIKGMSLKLDVNEIDKIPNVIENINEKFGNIDILVNNAGITRDMLFVRMSDIDWQNVISTNLSSAFYLSKAIVKTMMKKKEGNIINISSTIAFTGNIGQANYSAAKAGLIGLTKSLALEFGRRNIRVNAIAPGFVQTDMTDKLSDKQKQEILQKIPLNKLGQAQDIANAVLFLASDNAKYITGQTIHINGGMYMA